MKKMNSIWKPAVSLLLSLFLIGTVSLIAQASSKEFSYFDDITSSISEGLKKEADKEFKNLRDRYGTFCLITVSDQKGKSADVLATEYLDEMGITDKTSVLLLYLNISDHSVGLATRGEAKDIFLSEYNDIFYEHERENLLQDPSDLDQVIEHYQAYCKTVLDGYYLGLGETDNAKDSDKVYVDDAVDYFSEEAKEDANLILSLADSLFDMDIRITAQPKLHEETVDLEAIKYIQTHKLGENREKSAFILFISKKPRKFSLMARDRAQDIFTPKTRKDIFDDMLPYMKEDDYDGALQVFLNETIGNLIKLNIREALKNDARDEGKYLFEDVNDPLPEETYEDLNNRLAELSDKYEMDIVAYIQEEKKHDYLYNHVMEFAIKNRFGDQQKNDALVFFINLERGAVFTVTRGKAGVYLFGDKQEKFDTNMFINYKEGSYENAIEYFIDSIDPILNKAFEMEEERASGTYWFRFIKMSVKVALLFGIVGFFIILIKVMKEGKREVSPSYVSALTYVGGVIFNVKNDKFLYSSTHRVYDNDDSSSGSSSSGRSSSSYSSGGSSYGGTSGDY